MATNRPNQNGPAPYRPPFRVSRVRAQVKQLRDNRKRSALLATRILAIRTPAGNGLTKAELEDWIDDDRVSNPAIGRFVEVYIEQLCYYINTSRNLSGPHAPANALRAMLTIPRSFYLELSTRRDQAASQLLRTAGITTAEFVQLEYFFIPIEFAEHSCLLAVSPRHHTIELCDSTTRAPRPLVRIFSHLVRFLIHELGALPGPRPWMFKYNQTPTQHWASECGNFTCLFARALATYQPLRPHLDIGQGAAPDERALLRFRVADELLLRHGWSALTHPIGDPAVYGPAARHSNAKLPGIQPGLSEPQYFLFRNFPPFADPVNFDIEALRSRTGRFDHFATNRQLSAWCAAQPPLFDGLGHAVGRMAGHGAWEKMALRSYVERVERREMTIAQGVYP